MEERTSKQLRDLTVLVGCGAAAGLIYMPFISEIATPLLGLKFGVQGMLITLLVFGFEFFVAQGPMSEPLRRAPFTVVFLAKTVITTLLMLIWHVRHAAPGYPCNPLLPEDEGERDADRLRLGAA